MSYDIFLQHFSQGQPEHTSLRPLWDLVAPYVDGEEAEFNFIRVETDSGGADIYGLTMESDAGTHLMISRHEEGTHSLIFDLAYAGRMVILLPEGDVVLVNEELRSDLPPELASEDLITVISDGAGLREVIDRA